MHLLDTDTLIHLHAGNENVVRRLAQVPAAEVGISIITWLELMRARIEFMFNVSNGAELLRAQELLIRTRWHLTQLQVMPVDRHAADVFDKLRANKRLKKIGRADLLIASIALARPAVLVTRNLRHFEIIPQLHVVNWVD